MDILQREKPLQEIASKIQELNQTIQQYATLPNKTRETQELQQQTQELTQSFEKLAKEIFTDLSPYQITQLSRHPNRPYTLDIVNELCSDFIELHGDRNFMDDKSIVAGIGSFRGIKAVFIGHQKGRSTKENVKRNFGMPRPEGYRKALRLMSMAERFHLPIITFIDTPGAYPGIDAEERGQSEAIAKNIMVMSRLSVPIVTVVVGEGGSGGALAIGVANRVLMMEYGVYSVISPEGCASILWKDGSQADKAAQVLGLTANIALKNQVIDGIIQEPLGGAQWNHKKAIETIGDALEHHIKDLSLLSKEELKAQRLAKYAAIGKIQSMPAISPFRRETSPVAAWDEPWSNVEQSFLNKK